MSEATAIASWEVLDLLQSLIDKSLVVYEEIADGQGRYRLLETVRQYASEKETAEDSRVLSGRHGAYFLALAEEARTHYDDDAQRIWMQRLETEHDNLRTALHANVAAAEPRQAEQSAGEKLRFVAALAKFWWTRGYMTEGRAWAASALARSANAPASLRADALHGGGVMAAMQGDYGTAQEWLTESLALQRSENQPREAGLVVRSLGALYTDMNEQAKARACLEEALALFRASGDRRGIASVSGTLGIVSARQDDLEGARAMMEESLAVLRSLGDAQSVANTLHNLGVVLESSGHVERARACYTEALKQTLELGNKLYLYCSLEALAGVAITLNHPARAVCLYAAAFALRESVHEPQNEADYARAMKSLQTLRQQLGDAAYQSAYAQGSAMTLDESLAYALSDEDVGE